MSDPRPDIRRDERIAALEHAVFGVGDGGGMIAEMRALRAEFHEFRQEVGRLYKMVVVATFSLVGTALGGLLTFVLHNAQV